MIGSIDQLKKEILANKHDNNNKIKGIIENNIKNEVRIKKTKNYVQFQDQKEKLNYINEEKEKERSKVLSKIEEKNLIYEMKMLEYLIKN